MSGFDDAWLALREGADAEARDAGLARALDAWLGSRPVLRAVDLACGNGAAFRWLAPRIARPQRWLCVDADATLLAALRTRTGAWARVTGWVVDDEGGDPLLLDTPSTGRHAIATRCLDLATGDLDGVVAGQDLVSASALVDLVSEDWVRRLAAACAGAGCAAWLSLGYDGRTCLSPGDVDDELVLELFNAHQRRDKGFGPALGPLAPVTTALHFDAAGYRTRLATSDWHLGAAHGALVSALLDGWASAAAEQAPDALPRVAAWRERRRAQCRDRALGVVVGHRDLLALPVS